MCQSGTFVAALGQTVCLPCPAGTYIDTAGQTACAPCPRGTYRDANENVARECAPCPPDSTTTSSGASRPSDCVCNYGFARSSNANATCGDCTQLYCTKFSGAAACVRCVNDSVTSRAGYWRTSSHMSNDDVFQCSFPTWRCGEVGSRLDFASGGVPWSVRRSRSLNARDSSAGPRRVAMRALALVRQTSCVSYAIRAAFRAALTAAIRRTRSERTATGVSRPRPARSVRRARADGVAWEARALPASGAS